MLSVHNRKMSTGSDVATSRGFLKAGLACLVEVRCGEELGLGDRTGYVLRITAQGMRAPKTQAAVSAARMK